MNKIPVAIPPHELVKYKADIQAQAIGLFKGKETVFSGRPRRERWRSCIHLVAECWMRLGPQSHGDGSVIILPPKS